MVEFTRRNLMKASVAASLGASVVGAAHAQSNEDGDTPRAPVVKDGKLERFAWTALGAEVTGPEVTKSGTLFFSVQHPSRGNPAPFDKGGIGYVKGHDFTEDDAFGTVGVPNTKEKQGRVAVGSGEFTVLAQEGDNIGDDHDLGYPVAPDGLQIDEFEGSRYGNFGYNPDCNRFVPTNGGETKGYLYTNFEQSPGDVSQIPVKRTGRGEWKAEMDEAQNLSNTDALRELGGTRINCYGDVSPWGTYLSAEEEYSHARVGPFVKTSDFGESEGPNQRGAAQFYNRPNPAGIAAAVSEHYGDEAWYPQGTFALAGLELQAYYLGADPVGQGDDATPIQGPYPNPYRYGYIVDFRDSDTDEPKATKYYCMGRAAWECPDVQADEKTTYLSSDGENKGFYKFVADEPIPSYDDPMDVEGTLYAAKVTNEEATAGKPPAEANLELEWLALSRASNREVAEWIAEYDGVDQVDYLESHADTDWREDLQKALEEADRAVVENGNADYVSDEEIVEWAELWSEDPDSTVDDRGRPELRKVPFLETRAAAKEIGATVEFRKSEGIDSKDDAAPGDYVYLGLSEVNTGMSDEEGDVRVDRVDGGLVYRARLDEDYDISTLEPVIVGPDATDTADVADSALVNVDNVFVMNDGRVLCCEDAAQFGRSYPNDCLYVYTPDAMAVDEGSDDEDDEDDHEGDGADGGDGDGDDG